MKRSRTKINLLAGIVDYWAGSILTVSSTSFNLQQALITIKKNASFHPFPAPVTVSNFPMIDSQLCFKFLLKGQKAELWERIKYTRTRFERKCSLPRLLQMVSHVHDMYSKMDSETVSYVAYSEAKRCLKMQLSKIRKRSVASHRLMKEVLPSAEIWCQLLDKAYHFEDPEDIELINYGFAAVEKVDGQQYKAKLVERVAADALFEGLSDGTRDLVEAISVQILNDLQDDPSRLETKAERLLAYVLLSCMVLQATNVIAGVT